MFLEGTQARSADELDARKRKGSIYNATQQLRPSFLYLANSSLHFVRTQPKLQRQKKASETSGTPEALQVCLCPLELDHHVLPLEEHEMARKRYSGED